MKNSGLTIRGTNTSLKNCILSIKLTLLFCFLAIMQVSGASYSENLQQNIVTGKITDIIVPGPGRVCGIFGRDSEYIIPWNHICKIGPDIILVEIKDDCKPQRIPI